MINQTPSTFSREIEQTVNALLSCLQHVVRYCTEPANINFVKRRKRNNKIALTKIDDEMENFQNYGSIEIHTGSKVRPESIT